MLPEELMSVRPGAPKGPKVPPSGPKYGRVPGSSLSNETAPATEGNSMKFVPAGIGILGGRTPGHSPGGVESPAPKIFARPVTERGGVCCKLYS